ncbi:ankyrin repeat-containing domain protein [Aspergillus venezuelensis]
MSRPPTEIIFNRPSDSQPALMACKAEIDLAGALDTAASLGRSETARLIFERLESLNPRYSRHCYPLHTAIRAGHDEIAAMLMESKADIDETTAERDYTPLMDAASLGRTEVVRALLRAGARPDLGPGRGHMRLRSLRIMVIVILLSSLQSNLLLGC